MEVFSQHPEQELAEIALTLILGMKAQINAKKSLPNAYTNKITPEDRCYKC
jgi:hypothetical protein